MKYFICLLIILLQAEASDKLIFGAISTVEPEITKQNLSPIIKYLEKATGKTIEFQTGYNYQNTINKFANGDFDIGYIGPAPYIKAKEIAPKSIEIIAGVANKENQDFKSVLISKKGSKILTLEDLDKHSFAFGSPQSTLSFYVPMDMLIKKNVLKNIKRYDYLARHDKVAQYVIMGKYDAGAVKKSVAQKYKKYLQIIQESKAYPDFIITTKKSLDPHLKATIKKALLELKDKKILKSLKSSAVGFIKREDSDYDELREILKDVEKYK